MTKRKRYIDPEALAAAAGCSAEAIRRARRAGRLSKNPDGNTVEEVKLVIRQRSTSVKRKSDIAMQVVAEIENGNQSSEDLAYAKLRGQAATEQARALVMLRSLVSAEDAEESMAVITRELVVSVREFISRNGEVWRTKARNMNETKWRDFLMRETENLFESISEKKITQKYKASMDAAFEARMRKRKNIVKGFAPQISVSDLEPSLQEILRLNMDEIFTRSWSKAVSGKRYGFAEWVETHRKLPPTAAHSGRMSFDRVPYMREIAEALVSQEKEHKIIVCRKGAQLTFSEMAASLIGYIIHQTPVPVLYFSETLDKASAFYRDRVRPMLHSEEFNGVLANANIRAGSVIFAGGVLELRGSNSPNAFSSSSAAVVILDEFARYPKNIGGGEGDPITLAKTRARSYRSRGKLFIPSTPVDDDDTEGGFSAAYNLGDQREYFMPCPFCGEYDFLRREDFVATDPAGNVRGGFVCKGCDAVRLDEHKDAMIAAGKWEPTAERIASDTTSFHCPGTLSPFVSWDDIAGEMQTAASGKTSISAIVNTHFGDPYREENDEIPTDPSALIKFCDNERDRGIVPATVAGLTISCDIQSGNARRGIAPWIAYSVWAWEEHFKASLVDWGVLEDANIGSKEGRAALMELAEKSWAVADGTTMRADLIAVDAGDKASEVYDFVSHIPKPQYNPALGWRLSGGGINAIAVKGFGQGRHDRGQEQNSALRRPEKLKVAKYRRYNIQLWRVNVNWIKARFFAALNYAADDKQREGAVSFPAEMDEEVIAQFLSERVEIKRGRDGTARKSYVKVRDRNEQLDLYVYARAAAAVLAGDTFGIETRKRLAARRAGYVAPVKRTGEQAALPKKLPRVPTEDMYTMNKNGERVLRKKYKVLYRKAGIDV